MNGDKTRRQIFNSLMSIIIKSKVLLKLNILLIVIKNHLKLKFYLEHGHMK